MSYVPTIKVSQARPGPTTSEGDPGVARRDLWVGRRVYLTVVDPPPGATYFWKFLDAPLSSVAVFETEAGVPTDVSPAPTFVPDLWGTYNIALYVSGTRYYAQITVSALLDIDGNTLHLGLRPFALGESIASLRFDLGGGDYNERHNVEDVYDIIRELSSASSTADAALALATSLVVAGTPNDGDVVYYNGITNAWTAGLGKVMPVTGQRAVPAVAASPGWEVLGAFKYNGSEAYLRAMVLVSQAALTARVRVYGPIGGVLDGGPAAVANSTVTTSSLSENELVSSNLASNMFAGETYQIQMECTGGALATDFAIARYAGMTSHTAVAI